MFEGYTVSFYRTTDVGDAVLTANAKTTLFSSLTCAIQALTFAEIAWFARDDVKVSHDIFIKGTDVSTLRNSDIAVDTGGVSYSVVGVELMGGVTPADGQAEYRVIVNRVA